MSKSNSFFIDCIRVLAAQFVLFGHSFSFFSVTVLKDQTYFPYIQNIGVILLFAISGFLFSYVMKKRGGGYSFKHYYVDRFIRIKIPFVGAMLIVSIISLMTIFIDQEAFCYYDAFNIKTFLMNIFMFQDYPVFLLLDRFFGTNIAITSFASARPFWTLAIEWWYYMFFGYFCFYLKNKPRVKVVDIVILGFFSVVPLCNLIAGRGNCLTLVWIGGVIIENIYKSIKIQSKFLKQVIFAGLLVCLITDGFYLKEAYSRSFQVLILLVLFMSFVILNDKDYQVSKHKFGRVVKRMASYSYSLYLVHYSILDFIHSIPNCNMPSWMKVTIGIVLSNIVAYCFAQFFENKTSCLVKNCRRKADKLLRLYDSKKAVTIERL